MTISLLLKVVVMCMYQIDPSFDKDECAKEMMHCTLERKVDFDMCSDYWEPWNAPGNHDDDLFGEDHKKIKKAK